jgi:hypothetical protein
MRSALRFLGIAFLAVGVAVIVFVVVAVIYNRSAHYQSQLTAWPSESEFIEPVAWAPDDSNRIRILAVDGGGIAGVMYLEALKYIEERSGRPISELFDVVAGTSTGAVLAVGLFQQRPDGRPKYSADEMIGVYAQLGRSILRAPFYHRVLALNGLLGPRYLNHTEVVQAQQLFGDGRFGELSRPAMVPVFSLAEGRYRLIRNWVRPEANIGFSPLIAAATAAPTIFPAVQLAGNDDYAGTYADAAIVLNNPSHVAFLTALERYPDADYVVLSLGLRISRDEAIWDAINGGGLNWVGPMLAVVFSGQGDVSNASLSKLTTVQTSFELEAVRFAPEIPWSWDIMDGSTENIERMRQTARDYIEVNHDQLDQAIDLLMAHNTAPASAQ